MSNTPEDRTPSEDRAAGRRASETVICEPGSTQPAARRPQRFWVMSDLHQEFERFRWRPDVRDIPDHDAVILAGDTHAPATKSIAWAEALTDKPVFMVMGNHEFYGTVMKDQIEQARKRSDRSPNVRLMENTAVDFEDIRILGCTLWTDFELFGDHNRVYAMQTAEKAMNDYRHIKRIGETSGRKRRLRPTDTLDQHRQSIRFLEAELAKHRGSSTDHHTLKGEGDDTGASHTAVGKTKVSPSPVIVITHHAPTRRGLANKSQPDMLSAAYASNLEPILEVHQPDLWVFGHTHVRFDETIGGTRLVSNARGYLGHDRENTAFDPALVISV